MNSTFLKLPADKRQTILEACQDEFIEYGYENASTNRIVQRAGIAKGSLFQYFSSKEELYYYILGEVARSVNAYVRSHLHTIQGDFIDRLLGVSRLGMDYYINDQRGYRMFLQMDYQTEIHKLTLYLSDILKESLEIYNRLLFGVDTSKLRYSSEESMEYLQTIIVGFKTQFFSRNRFEQPPAELRDEFMTGLEKISRFLKTALFKESAGPSPAPLSPQEPLKEWPMVKIEAALEILYCLMTVDNEIHETELKEILRFLLKAGFEVAENHLKTRDQEYEGLILKMGTLSALSRDALQQKYTQARDYLQTHLTADQKQRIMDYAVDMIVADGQVRPEEKELLQDLSLAWQVPMRDL